ncbi:dihydrouridine synthase Dus [Nitzschia inconspicua]|uniref:Dihydrouridine synthase Dus n=1 Tax=Nitzschia inconspicua TaxID=303405 RepID=A0A9K3Q8B6_9STRA|nr:dihydrouridine synthase Dus [Nitzschia inconspicua]
MSELAKHCSPSCGSGNIPTVMAAPCSDDENNVHDNIRVEPSHQQRPMASESELQLLPINDEDNTSNNNNINGIIHSNSNYLPEHVIDAWRWFRGHGCPRYWVAPLVGLSDKSFRVLCRRYGAHMCHTEMTDPGGFARSEYYRTQILGLPLAGDDDDQQDINISSNTIDRPLVLQLGSSHIPKLLEAIRVAVSLQRVDAIELNCGCPQQCAKKGNYGSFLLDPPQQHTLLHIIETIRNSPELPRDMPLLVKMRVLESIEDTVDLAQRIVNAGAGILTVHGRTRHQGGGSKTSGKDHERLASWPHIRAVKQAVPVPVIANGNVPNRRALTEILQATGCDGVMSGVGILRDPTLFHVTRNNDENNPKGEEEEEKEEESWCNAVQVAMEYLTLAMSYHTHPTRVSKHLLWMLDGKGFKLRAPFAREQALKLRSVTNSDLQGCESKCMKYHNTPKQQSHQRSSRPVSLLWLGQCLSISIFLFLHHCSTRGSHAYYMTSHLPQMRRHRLFQTRTHDVSDDCSTVSPLDKSISRQSFLTIFQSVAITSILAPSFPSLVGAKEISIASLNAQSTSTSGAISSDPTSTLPKQSSTTTPSAAASILSTSTSLQEGISGFVAGAALTTTKTLVKFPLDTATVRLQQVNNTSVQQTPMDLFQDCYNGVTVTLLCNIPAGAVFFAVKDAVKGALKQSSDMLLLPRWLSTCLAVAIAQIPYWIVRNPSEVIKVRQQANVYDGNNTSSAFEIIPRALKEQGVQDLYTGYWENILYAFPADVLKFVVYEMITGGNKDLSPLEGAEAGALATAIAQLVTTPLDVVRNRLMMKLPGKHAEQKDDTTNDYLRNLIRLGQEEGLDGLFAGAAPRVGKAILSGAIQFATYEETKQSITKLLMTGQS